MASFRNPMFEAEPYEEQPGSPKSITTPDELQAFYEDAERKDIARKLSKRQSSGTSIWSRKSFKRNPTASAPTKPQIRVQQAVKPVSVPHRNSSGEEEEEIKDMITEQNEKADPVPMNLLRSIIPDPLGELPSWYGNKDKSPFPQNLMRYPIDNPIGPRYYKNYHLIPPSQLRPSARPPSIFSSSFPAMTPSVNERSEDATRLPPSRTPSNSPLPTPTSSQTRIAENGGRRSRKTSQTAHDNVDLLDVTDPWGTNWHHQSPYDVGLGNGPVTADVQENRNDTRSRVSSVTTARRKTAPSPLSQSTSAVHLQVFETQTEGARLPRKLSKGRTPTLNKLFGNSNNTDPPRNAVSLPVTPIDSAAVTAPSQEPYQRSSDVNNLPKDPSAPSSTSAPSTLQRISSFEPKKKRGSTLGRLVKKFSILKKPTQQVDKRVVEEDWHHVGSDDARSDRQSRRSAQMVRQSSPEKPEMEQRKSTEAVKRIPPPSMKSGVSGTPDTHQSAATEVPLEADRRSSVSLEAPFSIGRLTIANPDSPSSSANTPTQQDAPLPPQKPVSPIQVVAPEGSQGHNLTSFESGHPSTPPLPPKPATSSPHALSHQSRPPLVIHDVPSTKSQGDHVLSSPPPPPPSSSKPASPTFDSGKVRVSEPSKTKASKLMKNNTLECSAPTKPKGNSEKSKDTSDRFPAGPEQPLSPVPFPGLPDNSDLLYPSINDSPLSVSSLFVNPPTPHSNDTPMPETPPPPVPSRTSTEAQRHSREPSLNGVSSVTGRHTETFKLIRSASGHVYASGETIRAAGEQWEVVENLAGETRDRSTKSKDRDNGSRREQRRQDKAKAEADAEAEHRNNHQGRRGSTTGPTKDPSLGSGRSVITRSASADRRRPGIPDAMISQHKESKSSRKRDEDRERRAERRQDEGITTALNVNKPHPAPPPPTPGPSTSIALERRPSNSARPTSELPSSADLNAMRAREAWEMERLWKAKSMYNYEPQRTVAALPMPLVGNIDIPHMNQGNPRNEAVHGSSHTSFMVQTPFQSQPSHIYHSMPDRLPPIVYSSVSTPSHTSQSYTNHHPNTHRSFPNSIPDMALSSHPLLTNPLPEPPRESPYQPAPLSQPRSDLNGGHSAEYWAKHAGLTIAH